MTGSMRMRRLLAALAVVAFGLGAAACGDAEMEGGGTTGGGAGVEVEDDFGTEGELGGDMGYETETGE